MKCNTTEKIELYQEEIINRNCANFQSFSFGGMIITGFILLVGLLLSRRIRFLQEYMVFFAYLTCLYFGARYCNRCKVKYIAPVFYTALVPIYFVGILMGTSFDSERPAITVMIMICCLTLFIIDKPWRMFCYIVGIAGVFALLAYLTKPRDIFYSDMINLLIYGAIGIGINYFSLRDRVESVENYLLVREKSEHDTMTQVFNRGTGEQQIKKLLQERSDGAFAIIDIDNFKQVNDTYGHQVGDEVICQVTRKIQHEFRSTDIVLRLGGDEFAVFATGLIDTEYCERKLSNLLKQMSQIETSNPECSFIHISIGCTIFHKEAMDFEELYRSSDDALYEAKRSNKGGYIIKKKLT